LKACNFLAALRTNFGLGASARQYSPDKADCVTAVKE